MSILGTALCSTLFFILDRGIDVNMSKEQLYRQAIVQWGKASQMDTLVEECAELIQAAQKYNHRYGNYDDVIEELADVEIMCEQMRVIFNPIEIDKVKKQKLERLQKRLNKQS